MRITYKIPFRNPILIPDHWPIPLLGGTCHVIEEDGAASALEVCFTGQPVELSPLLTHLAGREVKASISGRDRDLPFVKYHLAEAIAFLQCNFDLDLVLDEIEAKYEAERDDEKEHIRVHFMKAERLKPPLTLSFDLLARAIFAAEDSPAPAFESALVMDARRALADGQFLNSFRYSFLLIEITFGQGKFKTAALKKALKESSEFCAYVRDEISSGNFSHSGDKSDTEQLLSSHPSEGVVIDHLVDKRGVYFHGNAKRKSAWDPSRQEGAKTLAFFALALAYRITQSAVSPMFDRKYEEKFTSSAEKAGAEIVFKVNFRFQEPAENFARQGVLEIKSLGTKVTPRTRFNLARQFLEHFERQLPFAGLQEATCTVDGSGEKVFELRFDLS